jgi:predicted amidophosphoribosyltransferase
MNISDNQFDDIRPLNDNEVPEAIAQLLVDERFKKAAEQIVKPYTWEQFASLLSSCKTKFDFQKRVIYPTMNRFIEKTTKEMNGYGWENVKDIFYVKDKQLFEQKHILLVDDVITTGSTIEACGIALHKCTNLKISIATIGEVL